jgi:hypothetical protein
MNLKFLPAAREELDAASYPDERSASLADEFPNIGRPVNPIHR